MLVGYAPDLWKNTAVLFLFGIVLSLLALLVFAFRRHRKQNAAQAKAVAV